MKRLYRGNENTFQSVSLLPCSGSVCTWKGSFKLNIHYFYSETGDKLEFESMKFIYLYNETLIINDFSHEDPLNN